MSNEIGVGKKFESELEFYKEFWREAVREKLFENVRFRRRVEPTDGGFDDVECSLCVIGAVEYDGEFYALCALDRYDIDESDKGTFVFVARYFLNSKKKSEYYFKLDDEICQKVVDYANDDVQDGFKVKYCDTKKYILNINYGWCFESDVIELEPDDGTGKVRCVICEVIEYNDECYYFICDNFEKADSDAIEVSVYHYVFDPESDTEIFEAVPEELATEIYEASNKQNDEMNE